MKNTTDINIILDRSGSMGSCRQATISSFNEFIDGQKNGPDEAVVSLYKFDHEYEVAYQGIRVEEAPKLNDANYCPRGSTALLDAVGRTINGIGSRLSALPEHDRPAKVLVAIITDGEENASREYNRQRIFDMISHQKDKYSWIFVFLGANQDSYTEAGQLGISHGNVMNYAPTAAGIGHSTDCMTRNLATKVRGVRSREEIRVASDNFFNADEQAQGDQMKDNYNNGPTGLNPPDGLKEIDKLAKAANHVAAKRLRSAIK